MSVVRERHVGYSIRPGYKQTEVGWIPDDWDAKPLGKITNLQVGYAFKSSTFSDRGTRLLRGENVGYGRANWDDERRLPNSLVSHVSDYILEAGDVVIGMDRTFTKSGTKISRLFPEDCPSLLVQRVGRFVPFACNSDFLWALLSSNQFRQALLVEQKGMDIPHLSRPEILSPILPFPATEKEQEAIAEALGDADALVESLERLLAKKRNLKQAAMQQLLTGKKRLPGFDGEWETKHLGEFGCFLKGSGVKKDDAMSGTLPCVRYGEIYTAHDDCIRDFRSFISREVAATATQLQKGDLLFAGSGETRDEIGKCVAFVHGNEAYAGGDIVILRTRSDDALFFGYYLNSETVRVQKASKGQGDAVVHIGASALGSIECCVPEREERLAIAKVLSDMDAEIAAIEAKIGKAREIKAGMMQELLTGKTRLVN